ncbi:hypothetical protein ACPA9J_35040 [Pseudomonas aeruginosa]
MIRAALDAGARRSTRHLPRRWLLLERWGLRYARDARRRSAVALHRPQPGAGLAAGRAPAERLMAFHWRRDLRPAAGLAMPLYGSSCLRQQGFIWNEQAIGLQCHPGKHRGGIERCSMRLPTGPPTTTTGRGRCRAPGRIRQGVAHCRGGAGADLLLDYPGASGRRVPPGLIARRFLCPRMRLRTSFWSVGRSGCVAPRQGSSST